MQNIENEGNNKKIKIYQTTINLEERPKEEKK